MNNFYRILNQKCGSRSRMKGVNTHEKFQTPSTLRTGVMSRRVSGTNKTKKKIFSSNFFLRFWLIAPHEGLNRKKKNQTPRTPITQVMALGTRRYYTPVSSAAVTSLDQSHC